jgi:hypothetical protein
MEEDNGTSVLGGGGNLTKAVEPEHAAVTEFVFEVILLSVASLFGLVGNIGAIVLFTTMKRQLKFHRLMMMLSAFDLIYVALSFTLFALPTVCFSNHI